MKKDEKQMKKDEKSSPRIGLGILFDIDLYKKLARLSKQADQGKSAYIRSLIRSMPEPAELGGDTLKKKDFEMADVIAAVEGGDNEFFDRQR